MSACTFFGHHDCPSSIKPKLREVLIDQPGAFFRVLVLSQFV